MHKLNEAKCVFGAVQKVQRFSWIGTHSIHTTVHLSFDVVRSSNDRSIDRTNDRPPAIDMKLTHETESRLTRHFSFKILSAYKRFFSCVTIYTYITGNIRMVFNLKKLLSKHISLLLFALKSEICIVPIWSRNENESVEVKQRDPRRAAETYGEIIEL